MKKDFVTVKHLETGAIGRVPRRIAEHEVLGRDLVIVPDGTKPRVPLGGGHLETPVEEEQVEETTEEEK